MRIVNIKRRGALVVSTKIMSPDDAMVTVSNYRNNVKIRTAKFTTKLFGRGKNPYKGALTTVFK